MDRIKEEILRSVLNYCNQDVRWYVDIVGSFDVMDTCELLFTGLAALDSGDACDFQLEIVDYGHICDDCNPNADIDTGMMVYVPHIISKKVV